MDPREQLVCGKSEGDGGKELKCLRPLLEVAFKRMVHVSDAGPNRVEGLERAHQRAGRKNLDLDVIGRGGNRLGETDGAGLQARHIFRPVGYHLQLSKSLRDGGRWESQSRAGGQ